MIVVKDKAVGVDGGTLDLCAEATLVLATVYNLLLEDFSEEKANKIFAQIGKQAVGEKLRESAVTYRKGEEE